jgi:hypothetical protein
MCHLEGLRILYGLSSCVSVLLAALSQACLSIHKEAFKPDCNFLFIGEVVLCCPARPSNLISSSMLPQLQLKNKKRKSQDRNHSRLRLAFTQPLALPKPEVATLISPEATCSLKSIFFCHNSAAYFHHLLDRLYCQNIKFPFGSR